MNALLEIILSTDALLVLSAFLTAILSGVIGMGGGIILLSVMMTVLPAPVIVPLHGLVQLFSNGSRLGMHFKHIRWTIGLPIMVGGVIGIALAAPFASKVQSSESYQIYLALFILALTWKPKFNKQLKWPFKFYFVGFFSHSMSILFGATGPLLAPFFLNINLSRHQIIATKAFAQYSGHLFKVLVFVYLGFQYMEYWKLVAMMSFAVVAGTYVGKLLLNKVSDKIFIIAFKSIITLLCFKIIYSSIF